VSSPGGSLRPPSVNYAEVQIGTNGRGVIVGSSTTPAADEPAETACDEPSQDTTLTPENAAAISTPSHLETLHEKSVPVSPEPPRILNGGPEEVDSTLPLDNVIEPTNPSLELANVIELLGSGNFEDNSNVRILANSSSPEPTEPSTSEIAPAAPEILPPPVGFTEGLPPAEVVPPPTTQEPTIEVKKPPLVPKRSSSLEPTGVSSADASPTHKVPPKVARKPARQSAGDVNGDDRTSPARQDASAVLSTVPSVMDRIKVIINISCLYGFG